MDLVFWFEARSKSFLKTRLTASTTNNLVSARVSQQQLAMREQGQKPPFLWHWVSLATTANHNEPQWMAKFMSFTIGFACHTANHNEPNGWLNSCHILLGSLATQPTTMNHNGWLNSCHLLFDPFLPNLLLKKEFHTQ
jgi:hypothetical protein